MKTPSYNLNNRSPAMSPAANIVSVSIHAGSPSSIGGSSIHPSSSALQRAITPSLKAYNPCQSQFMGSSPLRFEAPSSSPSPSPLRIETTEEPQTLAGPSLSTDLKSWYSSRSILAPGDLKVTTVLETTCRLMEKYLLSQNPFPMEPELLVVTLYLFSGSLCHRTQANDMGIGD